MADLTQGLTTTDGIDLNEVLYGTVLPIVDVYNMEETLDLRALLCSDHDESYVKFDASGQWKFQELAEAEKPRSKKNVYGKRQQDVSKYGLNIGYTFDWLMSEQASSEEVARMAAKAIERDRALQTASILDTCLVKDSEKCFYDGSFTSLERMAVPPTYGANTFTAAHTHYNASGSTTLTLATITAMKEHIKQHGYKTQLWGLCNADMSRQVEDLAGWTAAATIPVSGKVVDEVAIEGWQGRLLGIDWKETEWMPDNYLMIIGTVSGMDKPLRYVQKKNPSAKGLILTPGSYTPKYPIIDADYIHWLNSMVIQRGAGVVYRINTTWTNPTVLTNVVQ